MLATLAAFVDALRAGGLSVSVSEHIDAAAALTHGGLDDRDRLRATLAATLAKRREERATFDAVFDVWFSTLPAGEVDRDLDGDLDGDDLATRLEAALGSGDDAELSELARRAVAAYAAVPAGRRPGTGTFGLYQTLRHLDFEGILSRLGGVSLADGPEGGAELDPLSRRLGEDELARSANAFRHEVEAEIRRRLVAEWGPEAMAEVLRRPVPADVELVHASRDEVAELRHCLAPLARALAARLARRRRHHRRGRLDVRATLRHSLATGGVPVEPRFRPARPAKPEIWVVADLSGSVAAFARFTLGLVHAISGEFSAVRSFAFVDGLAEVTEMIERAEDFDAAVRGIAAEADVVGEGGHSDYGAALGLLWERFGRQVGPRTTVLVLGDARSNYHHARPESLAGLAAAARHLYWLNPEPRAYWGSGDSVMGDYAPHCDGVFECRNLRQLGRFVEVLA